MAKFKEQKQKKFSYTFSLIGLYLFLFFILLVKYISVQEILKDKILVAYGIVVTIYFLGRIALSYLYQPHNSMFNKRYLPTITFAIPAKDEGDNIYKTITKIGQTNYPNHLFEIFMVNDGSKDNTLHEMLRAKDKLSEKNIRSTVISRKVNAGKREAMAMCVNRSKSEIIVFIDSDSFVERDTLRELVKYFDIDPKIGAVTAHTRVENTRDNLLTQLQTIHYYISFKAYKSTESLFGTVTCCPGCCTAYRRSYISDYMDKWITQQFLGVTCTYGDDRSLTNHLLRNGYATIYSPTAIATTIVPKKIKQFFKQQLRWKKSWTRETLLASRFFWKRNPIMAFFFYTGLVVSLVTPFIIARAVIWYPLTYHSLPTPYLYGLTLMAGVLSLYYHSETEDKKWFFGFIYALFYSLILNWQMFYAIATLRDQKWGTR